MSILTKIKEESHIVVPVFFLLILYINNMPVDFNIKVKLLNPQEIFPLAPKATFKNMLLIVSFTIFMFLFETGIGNWKWKYYSIFPIVLVSSWICYGIYLLGGKKYIKNGEVDGPLKGYVNDIKIDDELTAGINSGVATVTIVLIFLMFFLLEFDIVKGPYTSLIISIPVILCLSVLYLKADGVVGLIDGCKDKVKDMIEDLKKEPWYFWLYWGFIGILLLLTMFQGGSSKVHSFAKYINPYGTLGRDTNHPLLAVFVLLIMAYMFRNKKMGFVIFTVLIIIWEILYDISDIVKNNMKKTLLAFFILFLLIDASFSSNMINDEGKNIKKDRESE